MGLKGLLVGRKGCDVPKNCDTTGWLKYEEMLKAYQKCRFLFLPNECNNIYLINLILVNNSR